MNKKHYLCTARKQRVPYSMATLHLGREHGSALMAAPPITAHTPLKTALTMAVTAKDVKKLRDQTGAGMMDCKKALTEADGDFDGAVEILRKKGQKISEKRADREAGEGAAFIELNADKTAGAVVLLNCETDFVARNDDFQALGKQIAKKALEVKPDSLEALKAMDLDGKTLEQALNDNVAKIGEKLDVSDFGIVEAESVVEYLHMGGSVGVLVGFSGTDGVDLDTVGKDVAMQIAAMRPLALDKDSIAPEVVEKEREIQMDLMKQDPKNAKKPDDILEKIITGKMQRFFKERTLLDQAFVKENKKSVQDYISEHGKDLKVTGYKRIEVGG